MKFRCLLVPLARATLVAALAAGSLGSLATTVIVVDEEEAGALMGDLMFHADLLTTLDAMCPAKGRARDWQAVVRKLPADVRTPELRDLSRRLSTDAAQAMVNGSGGCHTRHYREVYAQTKNEYEALLEQWAQLSV